MGIAAEFKEFAMKGNVVDLAVGVIIGGAFGKIVSSFVGDVVMPPLGKLVGGMTFSELGTSLGAGADGNDVVLKWGAFLQSVFDFLVIALVLFMALRAINSLKKPDPAAPPPPPPASEVLLGEIRDLLRRQQP
jgi:large conductance mechanosensitive channel